jgi:hypothetical protein
MASEVTNLPMSAWLNGIGCAIMFIVFIGGGTYCIVEFYQDYQKNKQYQPVPMMPSKCPTCGHAFGSR